MEQVIVVVGAGQIGQAIARRVGVGKHVILADRSEAHAKAAADVMGNAGYDVRVAVVNVASRESVSELAGMAATHGDVVGLIHAAGVSPSQASPETILSSFMAGPRSSSFGHLAPDDARRPRRESSRPDQRFGPLLTVEVGRGPLCVSATRANPVPGRTETNWPEQLMAGDGWRWTAGHGRCRPISAARS